MASLDFSSNASIAICVFFFSIILSMFSLILWYDWTTPLFNSISVPSAPFNSFIIKSALTWSASLTFPFESIRVSNSFFKSSIYFISFIFAVTSSSILVLALFLASAFSFIASVIEFIPSSSFCVCSKNIDWAIL